MTILPHGLVRSSEHCFTSLEQGRVTLGQVMTDGTHGDFDHEEHQHACAPRHRSTVLEYNWKSGSKEAASLSSRSNDNSQVSHQ